MIERILQFGRMIKFSHTVFALPFALSSVVFAWEANTFQWSSVVWVVFAMVGARTAAMTFNRMIDARFDAENERTRNREIPAGIISHTEAAVYLLLSTALLVFSAAQLNDMCLYLSPVALIVILGYSYTKRFTWLCHIFLGLALALAPVGAWVAMTASVDLLPIVLGTAVMFWVSGFDIIYATQDMEFDQSAHLFSIPSRFGINASIWTARIFHLIAYSLLVIIYFIDPIHWVYLAGLAVIGVILIVEHRIVTPSNLEKVSFAFFNLNGMVSLIYFAVSLLGWVITQ